MYKYRGVIIYTVTKIGVMILFRELLKHDLKNRRKNTQYSEEDVIIANSRKGED